MSTRIENLVPPDLASLILSESSGRQVWLVGGAIRDFFLDLQNPDLDFAVEQGAARTARRVADSLGVPYFVLDSDRDTARVLIADSSTLDFARLRADAIEKDLALRDFTINACATNLAEPSRLIDPLGGLQDIKNGVLRACAADSLVQDPIRALRGIRLAAGLKLRLDTATKQQIRAVGSMLEASAAERKRDELSKLLETDGALVALRLARRLAVLHPVLPELANLPDSMWDRSLRVAESLIELIGAVASSYKTDDAGNLRTAELSLRLGRFRKELEKYLASKVRGGHRVRQILLLAALYSSVDGGAEAVHTRTRSLRYSEVEAARARATLQTMDRIDGIEADANDLEIHRFFQKCGEVGVDSALLHLARAMASELPNEQLEQAARAARQILEAWFESYDQLVNPLRLVRGDELANELTLEQGPIIGTLLAGIAEGQVSGRVKTKAQALELARELLERDMGEASESSGINSSSDQG